MIRFDSINKKPKIRLLAYVTAFTVALLAVLWFAGLYSYLLFGTIIACWLAFTSVFLIYTLIRQLRYNPYSYNTIYYPAFALLALFYLAALILQMRSVHQMGLSANYGMYSLSGEMLGFAKTFMILSLPVIVIFSIGLCASNIVLLRREGRSWRNLLGIVLSFVLVGGDLILFFADYYASGSTFEVMIHDLIVNLYAAVYLYFECMMIGTIIANLLVYRYEPDKDKDFIIVLGCSIRADGSPTPLLAGRIERALKFYHDQIASGGKPPVFVTSGGQGSDEVIPESTSMKNYLVSKGVPESHIIEENRSTSTYENMLFSKKIIDGIKENAKVIFSTTQYHVFRSGLKARRVKMRATGIGSKTKWYFWPNALVREFAGVLSEHRVKQMLILGSMVLIYILGTWYNYLFL